MAGPVSMPTDPADMGVRRAALDVSRSFLVRAPAGAGKTELLIQRALACLARVEAPEHVLALTFTNKAANEMAQRVLGALQDAVAGKPPEPHQVETRRLAEAVLAADARMGWNLLENPSRLRFQTIDRLNLRFASRLPVLSGTGGQAEIEEDAQLTHGAAIDALLAEFEDDDLDAGDREALADLLAHADNRAATLREFLVALLGRREQWIDFVVADDVDVLDMNRALATLARSTLALVLETIAPEWRATVVGACREQSHEEALAWAVELHEWPAAEPGRVNEWRRLATLLLTQDDRLRKRLDKRSGFPPKTPATLAINGLLAELHEDGEADDIARVLAQVRGLPDPEYPQALEHFRRSVQRVLRRLLGHLRLVMAERGRVDFTEVALRAHLALGGGETASDLLLREDMRIRHLLVDEMQDTSRAQIGLLTKLTAGWAGDPERSLFCVGDPKQSIYQFRQADVAIFLDLWEKRGFNGIALEAVDLLANFRSDPAIVAWCNRAFAGVFPKRSDPYTGEIEFTPAVESREPRSGSGVTVHARVGRSGDAEASAVAEVVAATLAAHPGDSLAILVRARRHARPILRALRARGIRYGCQDIDPMGQTPAIADLWAMARALMHPLDRVAWVELLRAPCVGLAWEDIRRLVHGRLEAPLEDCLRDAPAEISPDGHRRIARLVGALVALAAPGWCTASLAARTEGLWLELGGAACIGATELEDARAFFALLRRHADGAGVDDVAALEHSLARLYAAPEPGDVTVMTIHKSKGLEFDTVLLAGLGEGAARDERPLLDYRQLPGGFLVVPRPARRSGDDTPEERLYRYTRALAADTQRAEAQRLFYVAATRARYRLHLFGHATATAKEGVKAPSGSLLERIWPAVAEHYAGLTEEAGGETAAVAEMPRAPRLPVDWQGPVAEPRFVPRDDRASRPSERAMHAVADEDAALREGQGELGRLVGVMYHALVERIAREGLERWPEDRLDAIAGSLRAGLRHLGLPEVLLEDGVAHVLRLARNTLRCPKGRWILAPRAWAVSEYALAGHRDGRWSAAVIDRAFDEDGVRWIVDFKTAGLDHAPDASGAFLADQRETYRPQLDEYEAALRALDPAVARYRKGLYFPALQAFVEID